MLPYRILGRPAPDRVEEEEKELSEEALREALASSIIEDPELEWKEHGYGGWLAKKHVPPPTGNGNQVEIIFNVTKEGDVRSDYLGHYHDWWCVLSYVQQPRKLRKKVKRFLKTKRKEHMLAKQARDEAELAKRRKKALEKRLAQESAELTSARSLMKTFSTS